jgi:cysteine-rich repeat protein
MLLPKKHVPTFLAVVVWSTALVGGVVAPANAQGATETYLFRDTFAPVEGAGNVLVPVSNATRTIVTDGPDFRNGAFVSETISASACASTPTIRAWSFPESAGLRYDNAAPTLVTGSYSISVLMRFNPMDTGYARLIDFSNSTLDTGIYKLTAGVSFFPVGQFAAGSFVADQDVFFTITRDGGSKVVALYINGVPSGTYTDVGDLYAPSATVLYFLMDNTTGSAAVLETDPGTIAYLQISDTPITPEQVTSSLATICQSVSCGDGERAGTEECDDGNVVSGDGCSAVCTFEQGGCASLPAAATYGSIQCRLDALIARVQGESRLGAFQAPSEKSLMTAKARTVAAQGLILTNAKKARKLLQQAAKAIAQYARRLGSLTARKKLGPTLGALRAELQRAGDPIVKDIKTLRSQL